MANKSGFNFEGIEEQSLKLGINKELIEDALDEALTKGEILSSSSTISSVGMSQIPTQLKIQATNLQAADF